MEKMVIIGLGLIGGSMALDFKKKTGRIIIGIDKNRKNAQKALDLGIIDQIGDFSTIQEASTIIVSAPINVIPNLIEQVLDLCTKDALVVDVGSVKENVCKHVQNHKKRRNFVAAHPIAGTEFSGPEAAFNGLFTDKINIICEKELSDKAILERAVHLFDELQMKTTFMNAKEHDKHIAYVSHLSHISSFMLGKTVLEIEPDEESIFNMAGSGFKSTVRLAKSSPAMWTPIFVQNKDNILKSLNEYIKNLETFKKLIENNKNDEIYAIMQDTNRIKNILNGIIN